MVLTRLSSSLAGLGVQLLLLHGATLAAQDPPGTVTVTGTFGVPKQSEVHAGPALLVSQPPKALDDIPKHTLPPLPVGTGQLPQPNSPPTAITTATEGPGAPGDFRFWKNVRIPFAATAFPPEPSVAIARDTAFATANTYGAVSRDAGQTWTMVNPATRFPAIDGGVCCDQRVMHTRVGSERLTVWYMQYRRSETTDVGSIRIAVAVGRDELRSDTWRSWVFDPRDFGIAARNWLDFPDISYSTTHLFCASNVFSFAGGWVNSVVWRIPLAQLAQGGSVNYTYYRNVGGLGGAGSYRFAQTSGATMHFATHVDTATMRVFWLPDSTATVSYIDRSVPSWSDAPRVAASPNGVNWIGFHDRRVQSGYNEGSEVGFLWCCAQTGGRPFPFVRVARFRTSDRTLIAAHDVWTSTAGFGYAGVCTNFRGDRGLVMAAGGPSLHVRNVAMLVDQYAPSWDGNQTYSLSVPTRSPTSARWGDYFTCHIDDSHAQTFLCSAAEADPDGNVYPRYAWFSREADMPVWVDLDVRSTPVTDVPITVDVADRFGNSSGNTPFTRTYVRNQGYRLTAPSVRSVGGTHYEFASWSGSGGSSTSRTIEVSSMGSSSDTMTATYAQGYELTVNGPTTVTIDVSWTDILGQRDGVPPFSRYYTAGTNFTLTAPASNGGSPFRRWAVVVGTTIGYQSNPVLALTMTTRGISATAQYYTFVPGSLTSFGIGCLGSNIQRLLQTAAGTPEIGEVVSYRVQTLSRAPAWFIIGLSNTTFGGIPLPFDNAPIGAPGCVTYCSHDVILPRTASTGGSVVVDVIYPNDTNLIGGRLHTQYYALDLAANRLGITMSNAYTTVLGEYVEASAPLTAAGAGSGGARVWRA